MRARSGATHEVNEGYHQQAKMRIIIKMDSRIPRAMRHIK